MVKLKGTIPEEVIAAVLKRNDIVDIVGKYVHLTKQGRNLKGLCPFHSEKTPSFTVSPEKQIFNCFGCGTAGHVIRFVMEIESCSFPEAVRYLAEEAHIPMEWEAASFEETERHKEKAAMMQGHEFAAKVFHYLLMNSGQGKRAAEYLKMRGFSQKSIDHFQIGYAPAQWDTLTRYLSKREFDLAQMEKGGLLSKRSDGSGFVDRFRDRIMFPIRDSRGRVIAFGGRVLQDGQPKYLNTSETVLFNKGRNMYNYDQAKAAIRQTRTAVLFEGYVDVIKAWEAGVANGVATMGTALTEEHARLIKQNAERVVVCYDGDDAGRNAANKSLPILEKAGLEVSVALLPNRMDPDEYILANGSESFVREVIHAAVPPGKFRLLHLQKNYALTDDEGRLRYIQAALNVVARMASPTEREHYVKELSAEYGYSVESLNEQLHQIRQELQKKQSYGDNKGISWNNVMNDRRTGSSAPSLKPAYYNAETQLLSAMMENAEIAAAVQQELGNEFNVQAHAALADYIYDYYEQGHQPDPSRFIATLDDPKLEKIASVLALTDLSKALTPEVLDAYIREIRKYPQQKEIQMKQEEIHKAERSGDVLRAARIASEIIALERQMKSL